MKLIVLLLGCALGFGGGIYYGVKHPEWAKDFSQKEEQWMLKGKMEATQSIKEKLDKVLASQSSTANSITSMGRNLIGGGSNAGPTDALKQLRDEQQQQISDIQGKLSTIGKK